MASRHSLRRGVVYRAFPALAVLSCWLPLIGSRLIAQTYPQAAIHSPFLEVKLYLPDPRRGYYRGTRFDWSGVIHSLTYQGHQYFGQWFDKHDPRVHDAITGPVNVFDPDATALGYREAKPGEKFVRIGVGVLEKPEEPVYRGAHTYKVVDTGRWTTTQGSGWIDFIQEIPNQTGYAYVYRKRITLSRTRPEMTLSYSLKNTGSNVIDTTQFNHNFFVMDSQTSGPGMVARFGFTPRSSDETGDAIELQGPEIHFRRNLLGQERVYVPLEGAGPTARDYDIRVESRKTGCGVRITSDRPLEKLVFWSRPRVVGPEPYIHVRVEPGEVANWETRYEFYTFKIVASEKGS